MKPLFTLFIVLFVILNTVEVPVIASEVRVKGKWVQRPKDFKECQRAPNKGAH